MNAVQDYGKYRNKRRSSPGRTGWLLLVAGLLLPTGYASAHGVDHRIERGEAMIVHFSSHHDGPMAGAGFRVFPPGGQSIFASGSTDSLGRAVFVPDQSGKWRVIMATQDGHGAEVEVPVEEGVAVASSHPGQSFASSAAGRIPATAAGIGYLFGLAGLLALWRNRH